MTFCHMQTQLEQGNRIFRVHISDTGVPQLYEENMSSLSRRACYKCGNVGHYAGKAEAFTMARLIGR